jgi:hypothetical protein
MTYDSHSHGTAVSSAGLRSSMADLIATLRGLTAAAAGEYTVNSVSYWTDAQLQDVLDRHVTIVRDEVLVPLEAIESGGSVSYYDYTSAYRFLESTSGGTSRFIVKDANYDAVGTASYSVDYPRGLITFTATTEGQSRYLDGYSYDLNAAAADVWGQKASHYVTAYDFSTDNHNLSRGQIIKNCLTMAKEYAAGAKVQTVSMERNDT